MPKVQKNEMTPVEIFKEITRIERQIAPLRREKEKLTDQLRKSVKARVQKAFDACAVELLIPYRFEKFNLEVRPDDGWTRITITEITRKSDGKDLGPDSIEQGVKKAWWELAQSVIRRELGYPEHKQGEPDHLAIYISSYYLEETEK